MKRILTLILTAVFLSALSIPCAATDTARAYPGFSDVPEESASYAAIKLCYEQGLMNGTSDTTFNPQGKLNVAQLIVLAARLYDLQTGGDGTIPTELPDLSQSYLRFYDEDGGVIASFSAEEIPNSYTGGVNPYICLSLEEEDPGLPETCRLETGFEGYNHLRSYKGIKQSYHAEPGTMTQGFQGTGYCFQDLNDDYRLFWYNETHFLNLSTSSWWYPSLFYLISECRISLISDLLAPLAGEEHMDDYDPAARFSSDNANRALFAVLVDATAGELDVLNETVRVPDVNEETPNAARILRLYQAGILTGVDQAGNFNGSGQLTRAQAAIMLARVLDPALRVQTA